MNNANVFIIAVQNKKKGEPNRTEPLSADPRTEPNRTDPRTAYSCQNRIETISDNRISADNRKFFI
jgi:hypothetical protein